MLHLTNHTSSAKSLGGRIRWDNGMHAKTVRRQAGPQERIFLMLPPPRMHCPLTLAYPVDIISLRKKKKSSYQLLHLVSPHLLLLNISRKCHSAFFPAGSGTDSICFPNEAPCPWLSITKSLENFLPLTLIPSPVRMMVTLASVHRGGLGAN